MKQIFNPIPIEPEKIDRIKMICNSSMDFSDKDFSMDMWAKFERKIGNITYSIKRIYKLKFPFVFWTILIHDDAVIVDSIFNSSYENKRKYLKDILKINEHEFNNIIKNFTKHDDLTFSTPSQAQNIINVFSSMEVANKLVGK